MKHVFIWFDWENQLQVLLKLLLQKNAYELV